MKSRIEDIGGRTSRRLGVAGTVGRRGFALHQKRLFPAKRPARAAYFIGVARRADPEQTDPDG